MALSRDDVLYKAGVIQKALENGVSYLKVHNKPEKLHQFESKLKEFNELVAKYQSTTDDDPEANVLIEQLNKMESEILEDLKNIDKIN